MALFGKKKEIGKGKQKAVKAVAVASTTSKKDVSWVLLRPRITEKSTIVPEKVNAYVFEVHKEATSPLIKTAIFELYKVMPTKVNITQIAPKSVSRSRRRGGKAGFKSGGKKAYIYLKKGEKIEFV